jgi:2-desacetyl-2-hydroxyethyl bacteriochlorophyllide A dehydrogenase
MKAIALKTPGQFEFTTVEDLPASPSEIPPGMVLVKIHRIGICGTDLHAFAGNQPFFAYPRILGHELGVEVIAMGDVPQESNGNADSAQSSNTLNVGDKCAVEPYYNCGKCIACKRNKPNCCVCLDVLGVHIDGGMQPHILVPAHKLHRSEILTLDQLALVETLCIGCHAVSRADVQADEWSLVIGAGPIGLGAMQFAKAAGAKVIVMDINDSRLAFCKQQVGVDHTINALDTNNPPLDQLLAITNNDLPTTVFDATGNPRSMEAAFDYIAPSGQLVLIGLAKANIAFNDPHLHKREITIKASRNATPADFQRVIHLIEQGQINTTPWITHRAQFENMIGEFEAWTKPETGVIKAMVELT